jgi:hypothetical protein
MKTAAMSFGLLALAGTIVPPAVYMLQSIAAGPSAEPALSLDAVKATMLVSAIAWFVAAPFWMKVE